MQDEVSTKPLTVLLYIVHTTIVYSAWRWLTKPKHVADDTLLIKLCLDLLFISFTIINSIFKHNEDALLKIVFLFASIQLSSQKSVRR
jgi:hypothetical protein